MNEVRYRSVFVCLAAVIGLILAGCWEIDRISPVPSEESIPLESPGAPPMLAAASQMVTATAIAQEVEVHLTRITEQDSIIGVRWSEDGRSVIYATERRGSAAGNWEEDWRRYEISSGAVQPVHPPFEIDPQLWAKLNARPPGPGIWFWGLLSPSGTRVVYNRLPPGYKYTPAPDEFYLPPYEIWTARSDGSNALSLGRCWYVGQVIWLEQERKIIYSCGYEGPSDIGMVNVDGSLFVDLTGLFGGLGVGLSPMALSPDETKLAFTDSVFTLRIAALDGSEIRSVAQWGYAPNWSPDGRRLYYQQGQDLSGDVDIYVYDLGTGVSTKLVPSPLRAFDGVPVSIPVGGLVVSPLENAAVFENQGLWLVTWSP